MEKKIITCIIFLSFLLCGCATDSKIVKKSKVSTQNNNFVLSFNPNSGADDKCKTHIVVKKGDKIVLDERDSQCLDKFDIEYNPKTADDSLLYSNFSFVREVSENGKTYAKYHINTKKLSVGSTFESEDAETSIQIPEIITKNTSKNLSIELGKIITIKEDPLIFEITYSK